MCGRSKLSAKNESVWEHFDIHGEVPFEFVPRYNIAPTRRSPSFASRTVGSDEAAPPA